VLVAFSSIRSVLVQFTAAGLSAGRLTEGTIIGLSALGRNRRSERRVGRDRSDIPLRWIRTPPTSENARIRTVGAPGPGSGPPSILVPPIRLKPDASTRIPGGTVTRVPPTSDTLVSVTCGAASWAWLRSSRAPPTRLTTITWRSISHGPLILRPPTGETCQDGGPEAPLVTALPAVAASAGRSATSRSRSARVRAAVANSIRWLNSSRVSRPSPVAALSRSTAASRSASETRIPAAGSWPPVVSPIAASARHRARNYHSRRPQAPSARNRSVSWSRSCALLAR
jgi:hypothetical protein